MQLNNVIAGFIGLMSLIAPFDARSVPWDQTIGSLADKNMGCTDGGFVQYPDILKCANELYTEDDSKVFTVGSTRKLLAACGTIRLWGRSLNGQQTSSPANDVGISAHMFGDACRLGTWSSISHTGFWWAAGHPNFRIEITDTRNQLGKKLNME